MPNKKAAIKALRKNEKQQTFNSLVKRNIKEIVKKGKKAIADGTITDQAKDLGHKLQKSVDKAVKKGILKVNAGNRRKSRFMASINSALKAKDTK